MSLTTMTVLEAITHSLVSSSIYSDQLGIGRKSLDRLLSNLQFDPVTKCWLWQRAKTGGYGVVKLRCLSNSILQVHRVCYGLLYGPIPKGLHLHHRVEEPIRCSGTLCANPEHTMLLTAAQHTLYFTPDSMTSTFASRDFCSAGHIYTNETTRIVKGGFRQCRTCDRIRAQARRDALRVRPKYAKDPAKLKLECFRGHSLLDQDNIRWVDSGSGTQRVCLACERMRVAGYVDPTVMPSQLQTDQCKRGHPMEGDNVYIHPDGIRRSCRACRVMFTKGAPIPC